MRPELRWIICSAAGIVLTSLGFILRTTLAYRLERVKREENAGLPLDSELQKQKRYNPRLKLFRGKRNLIRELFKL